MALPDLDAAITQLATAVNTTGRERAAHSLLDPPIAQARERDWERRDNQRPPHPVPAEHLQNQRDLDRARARWEQARAHVDRLDTQVRDLQDQLDEAPRWARSRRAALTRTLTFTNETVRPGATDQLHQASRDVDTLTQVVDSDTQQLLDTHAGDRERRQQAWLERSDRTYVDPNPVIAPADPAAPAAMRRREREREPYRNAPKPSGPVLSM